MIEIKELRKRSKALSPIVRIGKNGITDNTIEEIKKLLKKRKLIKVKMLKSVIDSIDKKKTADKLASSTGAVVVDHIGNTISLFKK